MEQLSRQYSVDEFQHERDKKLTLELLNSPNVQAIMDWMREQKIEAVYQYVYQSSYLRLTQGNAHRFLGILSEVCQLFGLKDIPPVYITREYDKTIHICGITEPFLLISSKYLERLEQSGERMLFGVLASQTAGIKANHHYGLALAWCLEVCSQKLPRPLTLGVDALVNDWKRCRFYTCDRAFLLATQDYQLALKSLFINILSEQALNRFGLGTRNDAYLPQLKRFKDQSNIDNILKAYNSVTSDTAWLPGRYEQLAKFRSSLEKGR